MKVVRLKDIIIIRGGGDIATGVIQKYSRSGFRLLVLEVEQPTAIRRSVALCEAVYQGHMVVEDISCTRISNLNELDACFKNNIVPIMVDPTGESIDTIQPTAVIDVILAKRNLGTNLAMAPITIALGPGFCAGKDVHAVIETMRGHDLGRLILEGSALPNTGIPGEIGGKSAQRVIYAPAAGTVRHFYKIGDVVDEGEAIFEVDGTPAVAPFTGLLRGLIHEGLTVKKGMKSADIDPRLTTDWRTISDKARCLGGAALEAYLYLSKLK